MASQYKIKLIFFRHGITDIYIFCSNAWQIKVASRLKLQLLMRILVYLDKMFFCQYLYRVIAGERLDHSGCRN